MAKSKSKYNKTTSISIEGILDTDEMTIEVEDKGVKDLKEVFIYKTDYFKDNNLENFKNIYVVFESKFLDFQENYYTNYVNINPDYKKTCVRVANVLRDTYLEWV